MMQLKESIDDTEDLINIKLVIPIAKLDFIFSYFQLVVNHLENARMNAMGSFLISLWMNRATFRTS